MAPPGQIKKAVLCVCAKEEKEGIAVCPIWGIRGKVAVGNIYPYFY
jgi:hypothetical protein